MLRLNFILLLVAVASALGVVRANHEARKLFVAMEAEQKRMRDLDVEWGQLQLEQSTWAAHMRIEKLAREKLGMKPPVAGKIIADFPANSPAVADGQVAR
ncbi:MAG: cell division protein FtsL [Betaproteobacteria bacterium HGW-Betaproteobacteria-11]|nr:MAG: cell division protein FtsL [Betaproteobacteria bacterium HGW-Betaproteobacteria-11]